MVSYATFPIAGCKTLVVGNFFYVANLWPECTARDVYWTVPHGTECKNPRKPVVAATFEKANTYVFDGLVIMNPTL
jgi:hypothetical protein